MKRIATSLAFCFLLVAATAFADGTVTTPVNVTSQTWKIGTFQVSTGADAAAGAGGAAGATIVIYFFDGSGNHIRSLDAVITLTGAELLSLNTTMLSPVAGESGSDAKKWRQRITFWLTTNGKITNVTPE